MPLTKDSVKNSRMSLNCQNKVVEVTSAHRVGLRALWTKQTEFSDSICDIEFASINMWYSYRKNFA